MVRRNQRSDPAAEAAEVLYGLPLAAFIAERKRLAGELRAAGEAEAAAAVAALAKPSVSAWVVNRLYRDAHDEIEALLDAGQRMRAGDLAATPEQRAVLARLHQRAGDILRSDGHAASPSMLRRVTTTLQALSAIGSFEPDAPGQLAADRDPPGFDLLAGVAPPVRPREPARRAPSAARPARERAAAREEEEEVDPAELRRQQRVAAQRKLLERTALQARRRADARASELADVRAELERAEAICERLRTACRRAEEEATTAREAADAALRALEEE